MSFGLRGSDKEHGNLVENQINRRKLIRTRESDWIGQCYFEFISDFPQLQLGSSPFFIIVLVLLGEPSSMDGPDAIPLINRTDKKSSKEEHMV